MDIVLFVGFVLMFLSTGTFFLMSTSYPVNKRTFHFITMFVTGIASIAYFTMAFGGGTQILTLDSGETRKFYYVRYIDWTFTTPLLLLDIGLFAGASIPHIGFVIGCDILMIMGGLIGPACFAIGTAKWALFAIGMVWFLPIIYAMLVEWSALAQLQPAVQSTYSAVAYMTVVLWTAYPVMWILAEGTGMLSESMEVILYTILDVTAKAVLGFVLLSNHSAIEVATAATTATAMPAAANRARLLATEPSAA